jgi:hypothetical protein
MRPSLLRVVHTPFTSKLCACDSLLFQPVASVPPPYCWAASYGEPGVVMRKRLRCSRIHPWRSLVKHFFGKKPNSHFPHLYGIYGDISLFRQAKERSVTLNPASLFQPGSAHTRRKGLGTIRRLVATRGERIIRGESRRPCGEYPTSVGCLEIYKLCASSWELVRGRSLWHIKSRLPLVTR